MRRHYTPTLVREHIGPDTQHLIYHFENGYGVSVIPEYTLPVSYNYDPIPTDRLELAVLKYNGTGDIHDTKNWSLCYNTPITNYEIDTLRNLTQDEVDAYLDQIANL